MKNLQELENGIRSNAYDSRFKEVYADERQISYQKNRYLDTIARFRQSFGGRDVEIYSVPGRTEIGGNHTDHQHGNVLAAAINIDAIAVCSKSNDDGIEIRQEGYAPITIGLDSLEAREDEKGTPHALVRGVAAKIASSGYLARGFEAYIANDILIGSGLSSSASYGVLVGSILSGLYNDGKISLIDIAKTAQYAEREYFDKPCGLMDQVACALGGMVHIDFHGIDGLAVSRIEADLSTYGYSLCIVDTRGSHAALTNEYASIPSEMKAVARCFGKEYLADVDVTRFMENISDVRQTTGDRAVLRAMHFFRENRRVREQAEALEKRDFGSFLALIQQSGDSSYKFLQNVYTNSDCRCQDLSIGIAVSESVLGGKGATRVHGGGFAGTILAFVPVEMLDEYKVALDRVFGSGACRILKLRKSGGIKVF